MLRLRRSKSRYLPQLMINKTLNTKRSVMYTDFSSIDREALARDIDAMRDEIGDPTQADLEHLKKVERWGRIAAIFGYSIAWLIPFNPIAALLISIGNITRWANVAHPVLHGAYDKVPGVPKRYTRKGFAHGKRRRLADWLDWIEPKAWIHEHNIMHHYHLGELDDPDHIEHNMTWLRESRIPMALRYLIVIVFAGIWKLAYYAPNTLKILGNKRRRRQGLEEHDSFLRRDAWSPFGEDGRQLWLNFYLPYALFRFVLLPAPFLLISPQAALNVLFTSLLAELFANLHSFLVIIPNHSAADIYRFDPVRLQLDRRQLSTRPL